MDVEASSSPQVNAGLAEIPQMLEMLHSGDPESQLQGVTKFRKLLSVKDYSPISEVISTGAVSVFTNFLKRDSQPKLQFEAAWALTNITAGTSDHTHAVTDAGAVPQFVQLMSSPSDDVREQAVWALGNIAGESPECRDLVLHAGALAPLLSQLSTDSKLAMLRNATFTLSNFCRGKPQPVLELVTPALPKLATMIYTTDQEVLTDACWALSYLSNGSNDRIQAVVESDGVCSRLVELLMHSSPNVQIPALRTLGNVATGSDTQTQVVIDCGVLPALLSLLQSPKKSIRKEACWIISNIAAGTRDQIQCVIEENLIEPLVEVLLIEEEDLGVKKEAAWVISNATATGTPDQIKHLVTHGCIRPLCDLLGCPDAKVITVALEGLENILKTGLAEAKALGAFFKFHEYAARVTEAGGLFKLEDLQGHDDTEICHTAIHMLETYFSDDIEETDGEFLCGLYLDELHQEEEEEEAACQHAAPLLPPPGPQTPSIAIPLTGIVELPVACAVLQVAAATTDAATAAAVAAAADGAHAGGSLDAMMDAVSTAELRAFRAEHFAAAAPMVDGHGNLLAAKHQFGNLRIK